MDDRGDKTADRKYVLGKMPPVTAALIGISYSIFLGMGVSSGVKWLHHETPQAHKFLETFAWIIGSGMGCAVAARLAKRRGMIVGLFSASISASFWLILWYFLRDERASETGQAIFGHHLTVSETLGLIAALNLAIGAALTWFGFQTNVNEDWAAPLIEIRRGHWFWLWLALSTWLSALPVIVYTCWLLFATLIYSVAHPSLWFSDGASFFWASLGITSYLFGIQVSLQFLLDPDKKYSKTARFFGFLGGTGILVGMLSTFLLNLDIQRMTEIPKSLGSSGWWLL